MDCLRCGAELGKSDIYCIECGAPVLTEDDVATMLSTDNSKYIDIVTNSDGESASDTMPFVEQDLLPVSDEHDIDVIASNALGSDLPISGKSGPDPDAQGSDITESMTQIYEKPKGKTKAIKRLRNIAQKGFHWRSSTQYGDELPEVLPEKRINRTAVIAITIVVCFALVGVGLYIFVRPQGVPPDEDSLEQESVIADLEDDVGHVVPVAAMPTPDLPLMVVEVLIFNGDHVQTAFHAKVDGTVLLHAKIIPDGADAVITWVSGDTEILDVVPLDSSGVEANIIGKTAGIVDITISAGDFVVVYPVTVDDYPMHLQLEEAIEYTTMPIWIDIVWSGGRLYGQETFFERDPNMHIWFMENSSERFEVKPVFDNDGVAFSFNFNDSQEIYYFFADGTGYCKLPDSTSVSDFMWFTWEFSTSKAEPEG